MHWRKHVSPAELEPVQRKPPWPTRLRVETSSVNRKLECRFKRGGGEIGQKLGRRRERGHGGSGRPRFRREIVTSKFQTADDKVDRNASTRKKSRRRRRQVRASAGSRKRSGREAGKLAQRDVMRAGDQPAERHKEVTGQSGTACWSQREVVIRLMSEAGRELARAKVGSWQP